MATCQQRQLFFGSEGGRCTLFLLAKGAPSFPPLWTLIERDKFFEKPEKDQSGRIPFQIWAKLPEVY